MKDIAREAESVILQLKAENRGKWRLQTNQLRKFLTAVNSLTNHVNVYKAKHPQATELPEELVGEVQFLKVKAAYQAGRFPDVRKFMDACKMENSITEIGTSIEKYEEFSRYMEALVAYHKYHEGDN